MGGIDVNVCMQRGAMSHHPVLIWEVLFSCSGRAPFSCVAHVGFTLLANNLSLEIHASPNRMIIPRHNGGLQLARLCMGVSGLCSCSGAQLCTVTHAWMGWMTPCLMFQFAHPIRIERPHPFNHTHIVFREWCILCMLQLAELNQHDCMMLTPHGASATHAPWLGPQLS